MEDTEKASREVEYAEFMFEHWDEQYQREDDDFNHTLDDD